MKKGSEILGGFKLFTHEGLLELGTQERLEENAFVKYSEVAQELRKMFVVPEDKWKAIQETRKELYSILIKKHKTCEGCLEELLPCYKKLEELVKE